MGSGSCGWLKVKISTLMKTASMYSQRPIIKNGVIAARVAVVIVPGNTSDQSLGVSPGLATGRRDHHSLDGMQAILCLIKHP